jgi:hypothetical protein
LYIIGLLDKLRPHWIGQDIQVAGHLSLQILQPNGLRPIVSHLAQALVPLVVAQPELPMSSTHVVRKRLEVVFDLIAFMSVVGHEGVDIDDKILLGAVLHVIVTKCLQVCMLVPVTLQERFFIVSTPDLMKGAAGADNISTRNPHGGKGDARTVPKNGCST